MLAQAQEMSYELMHAKRASNPQVFTQALLAQVASSCADLYADVAKKYEAPSLTNHFDKEWAVTGRVKHFMYQAEADYLHAMHLEPMAGARFGEHLGHLRRAASTLQSKHKDVKLALSGLQKQFKVRMPAFSLRLRCHHCKGRVSRLPSKHCPRSNPRSSSF